MQIKTIKLKNFQSYYGDNNVLNFSKGLNVVTGSIASGKSKLFDAFYWTLNDKIFVTGNDWVMSNSLGITYVNDRAKFESKNIDDLIEVYVEIVVVKNASGRNPVEQEYTIKRQFLITRKSLNDQFVSSSWTVSRTKLSVEYVNPINFNNEIVHSIEAQNFIEDLFPAKISPYIWFQGEALDKLIDFDSKGTIRRAIDYISYVPLYKVMNKIMSSVNVRLDKKKTKELRKLSGDIKTYDKISKDIEELRKINSNNQNFIDEKSLILGEEMDRMETVEIELAALSEFPKLNDEKKELENDISNINIDLERLDVKERNKFSSIWMLYGTKEIFASAADKLMEFEDYRQSLINKEYELPDDVPGDVYINKMLKKETCLICDRPAEKGTDSYNSIKAKLNRKSKPEYLNSEIEELNKAVFTYKAKLSNLSRNYEFIKPNIIKHKENLSNLFEERKIFQDKLQIVNDEIDKLYTKRGIDVTDGAKSHMRKHGEYKTLNEVIRNLNRKLEGAKASIKDSLIHITEKQKQLDKIQRTNDDVAVVEEEMFKYTNYLTDYVSNIEKKEYEKLISQIESEANMYFLDITSANNTIDGNIKIDRETYRVLNVDDDERELHNYNTGHYTLMKMCIINAIISLTNDYKDESYPFITDAPTSNLDENATFAYLKSISNTFEQSIVITKDISEDELEKVQSLDYINSLFLLKIKNSTGAESMNRKEAYTQITNLKN